MSTSDQKKLGRRTALVLTVLGVAAAFVAFSGVSSREKSEVNLDRWTKAQAIRTVDVIAPKPSNGNQELTLPGEVEAWYTAPIHARVSGYVKMWYKDIGAKVKAGDVLADIDTPDLDQQLAQMKGEFEKAEANASLAEVTAKRWQALSRSDAVSQQAIDEKTADYKARLADVSAAKANVARMEAMEGFKKLTAPFDGVVTARRLDVGALVHGSETNGTELYEVSDIHETRIYVDVPQSYAAQLHAGMQAKLKLAQYPDRTFHAILATTADAITKKTRTLLVELHRDNKDGLLQQGAFVEVTFDLPLNPNVLSLPASALIFRHDKLEVATVDSDNKILMKSIEVGRDAGTGIEVLSGLSMTDKVVRNPSDSIADGDEVHVVEKNSLLSAASPR